MPDDRSDRKRVKASVLWGVVGGLAFLVLYQGYLLAGGDGVSGAAVVGVAVAVTAGATVLSYLGEGWLARRNKRV
ncbi:hypothetical protein G9464_04030 [Halostella sp. JP-L12]|uniref:hypothetical protein n=1 Tax=Halostella TaxID=1843185 RepID=UPI000EF7B383|nr:MULTISPECIES: hypothetical protein [Halostella]NHN46765.1 hypothetical protein [Halostella sp. JP-L12]